MAIDTLRELTTAEIDIVAGGKKKGHDENDVMKALMQELKESGDHGKGGGGASSLS